MSQKLVPMDVLGHSMDDYICPWNVQGTYGLPIANFMYPWNAQKTLGLPMDNSIYPWTVHGMSKETPSSLWKLQGLSTADGTSMSPKYGFMECPSCPSKAPIWNSWNVQHGRLGLSKTYACAAQDGSLVHPNGESCTFGRSKQSSRTCQ